MHYDGKCTCGEVRFRMASDPMFVHCCHCRWCQRETGTAFALNAMIEADRVKVFAGKPEAVKVPSESGKGQTIWRCPTCKVALWSNYAGSSDKIHFVRVGALLGPDRIAPDVHIYVSSKLPWVKLDDGKPQFEAFYKPKELWPAESLDRFRAVRESKS